MVKAYLRYVYSNVMGAIAGTNCNLQYHVERKLIVSGSNQYVLVLNPKTGELVHEFSKEDYQNEVFQILLINWFGLDLIASGYSNGDIILWDLNTNSEKCTLVSQKSQITSLAFDSEKSILASGSADCSIVLWDVIGESALCKLKGHKNEITGLVFAKLNTNTGTLDCLISAGKDGIIKVWDISLSTSIHTISSKSTEIWEIKYFPETQTIACCTNNDEIIFFELFSMENDSFNNINSKELGIFKRESYDKVLEIQIIEIEHESYLTLLSSDSHFN